MEIDERISRILDENLRLEHYSLDKSDAIAFDLVFTRVYDMLGHMTLFQVRNWCCCS